MAFHRDAEHLKFQEYYRAKIDRERRRLRHEKHVLDTAMIVVACLALILFGVTGILGGI